MKHNKKSQIFTIDLMAAMFIFIVLLTAVMLMWNRYVAIADNQVEYDEAQIMAYQISDILIKSQGRPSNWEENSSKALIIGLASSDRTLSSAKINAFLNMSYNDSKKILGIPYYDFSFQVKNLLGDNLTSFYGETIEEDFTISLKRYIFYENEKAIMELKIKK